MAIGVELELLTRGAQPTSERAPAAQCFHIQQCRIWQLRFSNTGDCDLDRRRRVWNPPELQYRKGAGSRQMLGQLRPHRRLALNLTYAQCGQAGRLTATPYFIPHAITLYGITATPTPLLESRRLALNREAMLEAGL